MFEIHYKDGGTKRVKTELEVHEFVYAEVDSLEPYFEIESVKNLDTGKVTTYNLAFDTNQDEK